MYKNLYETFKHWYHGGSIYFYSDPHFSDLDSYKLRFEAKGVELKVVDQEETLKLLDDMQIDNINKVCGKNDTLVILGDVGNIECVKRLKAGYKVLIMGNHDAGASNYKRIKKVVEKHYLMPGVDVIDKEEDNHLFDEVYEGTLQISPKIILSHEPVDYKYCFNIHGHVHRVNPLGAYTEKMVDWESCGGWYNCCAEQINYTPVCLKALVQSGILKNVPDIHRVTIDKASGK